MNRSSDASHLTTPAALPGRGTPATGGLDPRLLRDVLVVLLLPPLLRVTLSGPSQEFSNRSAFFQGMSNTGGDISQQLGTFTLLGVAFLLMRARSVPVVSVLRAGAPFFLMAALALLSIVWSDFPGLTLRRGGRLAIEIFAVAAIGLSYAEEPRRLLRILFVVFAAILAANFLVLPIPSRSFTPIGFNGIHPHKLETGRFLLIAIPVFLFALRDRWLPFTDVVAGACLLGCVVLLPLTQAKTAWLAIPAGLAGAGYAMWLARGRFGGGAVIVGLMALAFATATAAFTDTTVDRILDRVFADATLTGRDVIWRFALARYSGHEELGVGYGALWQTGPDVIGALQGYKTYIVNQAHNGYIDVLVQLGLVGVAALVLMLAWLVVRSFAAMVVLRGEEAFVAFYAAYLIITLCIINLTDTSFVWAYNSLWSLTVLLASCSAQLIAKARGAA